jgi:hypothetical protein
MNRKEKSGIIDEKLPWWVQDSTFFNPGGSGVAAFGVIQAEAGTQLVATVDGDLATITSTSILFTGTGATNTLNAEVRAISAAVITSGTLAIARGGTNSATALNNNRVMISSGSAIVEATAITASRALVSDTNGIPVAAAATTTTEIGYVNGVTSSIQTQLGTKAPLASPTFTGSIIFGGYHIEPSEVDDGNSSTADTIDWSAGSAHKSTLTGNCTYTFSNPVTGGSYVLRCVQDGTGSRTVTWPSNVKWSAGVAPTLTTTASRQDIINFYYDGVLYLGTYSLNYVLS